MFKVRASRPMHMLMARSRLALLLMSLAAVVACGRDSGTPDLGPPPPRAATSAADDKRHEAAMKSINPRLLGRFKSVGTVIGGKDGSMVAWLGCLTGDLPAAYTAPPELPPDGPRTAQISRQ